MRLLVDEQCASAPQITAATPARIPPHTLRPNAASRIGPLGSPCPTPTQPAATGANHSSFARCRAASPDGIDPRTSQDTPPRARREPWPDGLGKRKAKEDGNSDGCVARGVRL